MKSKCFAYLAMKIDVPDIIRLTPEELSHRCVEELRRGPGLPLPASAALGEEGWEGCPPRGGLPYARSTDSGHKAILI